MQEIAFRAMGCRIAALVDSDAPQARAMLDETPRWFEAWERCFSRFQPDSELSQLNARAGQWMAVSDALWDVIGLARQASLDSAGLVQPNVLRAVEAAGYDRTFAMLAGRTALELKRVAPRPDDASAVELREARAGVARAMDAIAMDEARRAIRLEPGARLDLGGIVKGWAAQTAAGHLSSLGAALVDAGGDIAVSGPRTNGERFCIGVRDPLGAAEDPPLDLLLIESGGVATSGRDYRRWQIDGAQRHHIIDPRVGLPALTDVLSATVIAPDAVAAEVGAKAALIQGSRAGMAWIEARPDLAGLLVLDGGEIIRSRRWHAHAWHEEWTSTWSMTFN